MVYDPTDEFDELEEPTGISALGSGRRKDLDALDAKDRLDDVQSFKSLEDMTNALREISLARRDGRLVRAPPEDPINTIESVYSDLPEDAQKEYLNDDVLHRRINAARKAFNRWMGKRRRVQQMPSPVEAGPANYPAQKARDTSRREREASEELTDRLEKVRSGARGGKQRALQAIGSSVAEHNAEKAQSKADRVKEKLEPGDIVIYRTTHTGERLWGVKRLNKKSVRLKRPHELAGQKKPMSDDVYGDFDLTTVDYDSQWLKGPLDPEDLTDRADEIQTLESDEAPDPPTYENLIRYLMSDDWVDDNLDLDDQEPAPADDHTDETDTDDPMTYDPSREWTDDRPQQDRLFETTAEDQAARDRETRLETGASAEFMDDREEESAADTGEQAALTSEELEGQASLTGDTAMNEPEWGDDDTGDEDADTDDWTGAVDYLREHYDDGYQSRIELAADVRKFASETDMDVPQSLADEGVLQPLIRHQNVDPADAKELIEKRAPEHHHGPLFEVLMAFAAAEAARHDGSPDRADTYDPCCEYENPDQWGPTADRPVSDVEGDLLSPQEEALLEEQDYHVAPDGRHRADREDDRDGLAIAAAGTDEDGTRVLGSDREPDAGLVSALEEQGVYDPTEDVPENEIVTALAKDLNPLNNTAEAVAEAASDSEEGDGDPLPNEGETDQDDTETYGYEDHSIEDPPGDWQLVDTLTPEKHGYEAWTWEHPHLGRIDVEDYGPVYHLEVRDGVILTNEADLETDQHTYEPYDDTLARRYDKRFNAIDSAMITMEEMTDWIEPLTSDIEELAAHIVAEEWNALKPILEDIPGETEKKGRALRAANHYASEHLEGEALVPWHRYLHEAGLLPLADPHPSPIYYTAGKRPERIEFGTLDAANKFRTEHSEYIHDSDDRRKKTVTFTLDIPEDVLYDAGTEAMIATDQSKKYGQVELTDQERDRLEDRESFSYGDGHLFHAQSAKALLLEEGGTPWLDYYDPNLDVDEHLSVIESGRDMAVEEGLSGPGEMDRDTEKTDAEIAKDLDRAQGEVCNHAEDGCEDGHEDACEVLLEDCGYAEEEIERLLGVTRELGEEPAEVYDPTTEQDTGTSFEEWARQAEPDAPEEVPPEMYEQPVVEEPTDEELAEIAPSRPEELSGSTLRALKKAWAGYRMGRAEDRQAHEHMEKYAEIINGIRVVNRQEPLDFDHREGWDGGEVLPDDPTEDFPVGNGNKQKTLVESIRDGTAGVVQSRLTTVGGVQSRLNEVGNCYDPCEEWE